MEEKAAADVVSALEKVYFGSVEATFVVAEGASCAYRTGHTLREGDPQDSALVQLSRARLQPAGAFLGADRANLILPAIPAVDLLFVSEEAPLSLPKLFHRPLLKSKALPPAARGVQSGRRSALIKTEGKWYRLKGCGDLYDGFPVRRVADRTDDCVEIRGCTFTHTATRELYMFDLINDLLRKHSMPISNVPIGWFEYATPGDSFPAVKRCCALYETKGERRLGDHVLVGLERALPLLLQNRLNVPLLLDQFEERRKQTDGSATSVAETWLCALTDCETGHFIDFYTFELDETAPVDEGVLTKSGLSIPDEFVAIWRESIAQLEQELPKKKEAGVGSLLAYLYWRFGREAGSIQRLLRKNDVSWGTYVDPLGTHCNAHPNNFVLLPEGESKQHFLAPMDFDMAFTRKTFNQDDAQFLEWTALEDRALKMALAGDENLSSGMTGVACLDPNFTILKWALRDTMVLGFISGYDGADDAHPPIPELSSAAHALIRLALILTTNALA